MEEFTFCSMYTTIMINYFWRKHFFQAGSRNETYDNLGVSHALRVASGLATKKNTAFGMVRNLQQVGGNMSCTQGREHTLYAVQVSENRCDSVTQDCFIDLIDIRHLTKSQIIQMNLWPIVLLTEVSQAWSCLMWWDQNKNVTNYKASWFQIDGFLSAILI